MKNMQTLHTLFMLILAVSGTRVANKIQMEIIRYVDQSEARYQDQFKGYLRVYPQLSCILVTLRAASSERT